MKKVWVFLQEVRNELKRISWPSRKEVIGATTVVIVTTLFMGLFLGVIDLILSRAVEFLLQR
ncbi:MAG TPA: preprotein translocase subunit SecE [Candidatus Limnocylindrales bacterium]|nr:preprotein translocase subunit SecE [Candidatus Limnocylindrales bacterium]